MSRVVASLNPAIMAGTPSGVPGTPPQAGGLTAISRWLRSNATTPPVNEQNEPRTPGRGCQSAGLKTRNEFICHVLRKPSASLLRLLPGFR
jgi:hypothetical protein